jgi:hypothetical protein
MSHTETEKDVAGGSAAVADNGAAALPPALPPADQVELVGKREETDLTGTTPAPLQPPVKPWGLSWRAAPWFITTVVTVAVTSDILAYVS